MIGSQGTCERSEIDESRVSDEGKPDVEKIYLGGEAVFGRRVERA